MKENYSAKKVSEKEQYRWMRFFPLCIPAWSSSPFPGVESSGSEPEQSLLMEMVLNKAEALFDKPYVGTQWPTGTFAGREMSFLSVRSVSY